MAETQIQVFRTQLGLLSTRPLKGFKVTTLTHKGAQLQKTTPHDSLQQGPATPSPSSGVTAPAQHISLSRPTSKREKSCFFWTRYLRIISVWGSVVWLPEKNVQHLSNLLRMLITAHQHLDTHKQNQSDYKSKLKTFSCQEKNKKQVWLQHD